MNTKRHVFVREINLLFSVQYKRDELVRRDNVVEKIEWDDDSRDRIRAIGLKLAYVARAGVDADAEGRIFEVRDEHDKRSKIQSTNKCLKCGKYCTHIVKALEVIFLSR